MTVKPAQNNSFNIVVLISGNGSNLQAIIDAIAAGKVNASISAVICNNPDAYGIQRATAANIPVQILDHNEYPSRQDYDTALLETLNQLQPQLIVLAGFMRILHKDLAKQFHGKMINIHPSLLPKYRGLHTHEKVIANGDAQHGVTIHFVSEELDGGPIIVQEKIDVAEDDTLETLTERIHVIEHMLYPKVIQAFAQGKIELENDKVKIDEASLLCK